MVVYDAIFLSPHLDDAVLSCGGLIYELSARGRSALVVTIMAGDPPPGAADFPFARVQHAQWALAADVVAARRAEDVAAGGRLGATMRHWPWPDCIYRIDPADGAPLYNSDPDIFGPIAAAEAPLVAEIVARLAALPAHDYLFAPLTVGHHVDHQLTRRAAERAAGAANLVYYEEFPYAARDGAVEAALAVGGDGRWRPTTVPLSDQALAARIEASAAYGSQLATLFGSAAALATAVRAQVERRGGERYWAAPSGGPPLGRLLRLGS